MRPSLKWGLRAGAGFLVLLFVAALVRSLIDVARGDAENALQSALAMLQGTLDALMVGILTIVVIELARLIILMFKSSEGRA